MTATTTTATLTQPVPSTPARPTWFAWTVRAEWIKFWTVRSTVWALVATIVVMVGVSVLAAWGSSMADADAVAGSMNVSDLMSAGVQMGQLAVAVLGVLTITGEYSTGMIRSTFAAVPRRINVLLAKAIVLSIVVFGVSAVSMGLSFVATMPWHHRLGASLDLTDPETLRTTVGLPLYLMAIALFAFTVGALLRHGAAALTTVIALLLVVENILMIIPLRAIEAISPFFPSTAGRRILFDDAMLTDIDSMTAGAHLGPWLGYGVLMLWVVGMGAIASVLLRRRDA